MGSGRKSRARTAILVVAVAMVVAPLVLARIGPDRERVRTPEQRAVTACHRDVGRLVDHAWSYPDRDESAAPAASGGGWVVSGAVDGRRGSGHPRRWFVCSVRLIGHDATAPRRSTIVFDNRSDADAAATGYDTGHDLPAGLPGEIARS
jgi:hypothetical protein